MGEKQKFKSQKNFLKMIRLQNIYKAGGIMMTTVWPCKNNGENKDTEMGTGITV
jgi:hypothetical protein